MTMIKIAKGSYAAALSIDWRPAASRDVRAGRSGSGVRAPLQRVSAASCFGRAEIV